MFLLKYYLPFMQAHEHIMQRLYKCPTIGCVVHALDGYKGTHVPRKHLFVCIALFSHLFRTPLLLLLGFLYSISKQPGNHSDIGEVFANLNLMNSSNKCSVGNKNPWRFFLLV